MGVFTDPPWDGWTGPSDDPDDEQFGDVVTHGALDDAAQATVAFVGEPYDGGVIGRRGAREGPIAIRQSLASVKSHHFTSGPVGSTDSLVDLGDVRAVLTSGDEVADARGELPDVADVQADVAELAGDLHELDALPVFLGGDNSLTVANAGPLAETTRLGVVNFDAHLDCRSVADGPSSGTPYRQLFEAGMDTYVCVGARHFETSSTYAEYVQGRGGEVITADAVGRRSDTLERIIGALVDVDAVYVSVDVDVLDAAAAPGASAPTPGGLSSRELFALLGRLAAVERTRIAGFEVVECAPPLDRDGRTVDAAARAVAHFLGGYLQGGDDV